MLGLLGCEEVGDKNLFRLSLLTLSTFLVVSSRLLREERSSHAGLLWCGWCKEQGTPYVNGAMIVGGVFNLSDNALWSYITWGISDIAILDGIWFASQCSSQVQVRKLMCVGPTAQVLSWGLALQGEGAAWAARSYASHLGSTARSMPQITQGKCILLDATSLWTDGYIGFRPAII